MTTRKTKVTSADVAFYFISADWGEMYVCTLIMEKQIKSLMTKIYNIELEAGKTGQMRGYSFVGKSCIQLFMFYLFSCVYLSFQLFFNLTFSSFLSSYFFKPHNLIAVHSILPCSVICYFSSTKRTL